MKARVFLSFAIPFDFEARNRAYSDSLDAGSRFTVSGWSSRHGELRESWESETRTEISRVDAVVVLVSGYTRIVKDVGDEVQIARELGKPILAIKTDEEAEPPAGLTELHGWDELRDLLSEVPVE
jgi:hypothetical protein